MHLLLRYIFSLAFLHSYLFAQIKPNILWLVIEDTSPDFIGCYGNPYSKTPIMDKLAKEGIRFTNAYSTNTVCAPSRSCIITGVRSNELGTGNHRSDYKIPRAIHGFPTYLRASGYYTTNNSKTDYNTSEARRIIEESWDESSGKAGWWNRKPGQPFFAIFNFMESHESRTMVFPYEQYRKQVLDQLPAERVVSENEFPLPPYCKDTKELRKEYARIYNSISLADLRIGEILQRLEKEGLMDSTIIFFYADHGEAMPRGKTNGIDRGYRVPFIIWLPPMYAHLSPWGKAGTVSSELIDFEDLAPTMVSLGTGKLPPYMNGRVLVGSNRSKPVGQLFLTQDRSGESPDLVRSVSDGRFIYSRNFMNFMPESRYMKYHESAEISQLRRNYFNTRQVNAIQSIDFMPRPAEYLFDTKTDRWEVVNLVDKKEYKPLLIRMRKLLDSFILAKRDIHFLPEYEMNEVNNQSILYEFRRSPEKYPLEEIYVAATLSGFQGDEIIKKQLAFLKSRNKNLRFWAMMGLRNQRKLNAEVIKELESYLTDTFPPVQILAASICYDNNKSVKAREVLDKYLWEEQKYLQLEALQQVTYMKYGRDFLEKVRLVFKKAPDDVEGVVYAAECYLYKYDNKSFVGKQE